MAARAGIGEDVPYSLPLRGGGGEIGFTARRISEPVWLRCFQEKEGGVDRSLLGRAPICGILPRHLDCDRRYRISPGNGVEVPQPFFAVEPDIDIDSIERSKGAHRIRPVLEDVRSPDRIGRLVEVREGP